MKPALNLRQIEAFRAVMLAGTVVGAARLHERDPARRQPHHRPAGTAHWLRCSSAAAGGWCRRPEAEALYREIEQLYGSIERIAQVAQDIRFQRAGALRVATLPALAQWLVPRAIARFLASRPKVTVFVQSLPSRQIAELVSTRQFDVGVVELPLSRPAIEIEPLEPVPSMAVMPARHRLAQQEAKISLKDLDGERMVLLSQHSYVRYQIDDAFSTLGVAPNVVLETPSSSIACALVAAGAGITLVSKWTAEPFAGPDLVVRPVKEAIASRYAIIFPQSRHDIRSRTHLRTT